ncbi:MAG: hypothetical protein RL021_176 [Bacteroidota bacterium]|jgi:4-hydroxybenzoate polyprenyltransferase
MRHYLSLIKFSHTVFALPFAVIGYFLGIKDAGTGFDLQLFIKVVLCMVFARTAAMAFNRYADRKVDARNERTRVREIPSGKVKPLQALALVLLSSTAFILVTYSINPLCFYLSPVALGVILGYSYTKRFTWLCHIVLGIGLALAPVGSYLAVTGAFSLVPVLFSSAVITWVSGFDIIYAMQDETFDRQENLYSLPASFGGRRALKVAGFLHLISILAVVIAGIELEADWIYWSGAAIFGLLLLRQHRLVRPDDLSRVDLAFFTLNGIASVIFGTLVVLSLLY